MAQQKKSSPKSSPTTNAKRSLRDVPLKKNSASNVKGGRISSTGDPEEDPLIP